MSQATRRRSPQNAFAPAFRTPLSVLPLVRFRSMLAVSPASLRFGAKGREQRISARRGREVAAYLARGGPEQGAISRAAGTGVKSDGEGEGTRGTEGAASCDPVALAFPLPSPSPSPSRRPPLPPPVALPFPLPLSSPSPSRRSPLLPPVALPFPLPSPSPSPSRRLRLHPPVALVFPPHHSPRRPLLSHLPLHPRRSHSRC
ncbi:unnamed protein product [Closterium sp. Yama58-4]|nr:unnamed protein product [Closterium sp. Yama58-4]